MHMPGMIQGAKKGHDSFWSPEVITCHAALVKAGQLSEVSGFVASREFTLNPRVPLTDPIGQDQPIVYDPAEKDHRAIRRIRAFHGKKVIVD